MSDSRPEAGPGSVLTRPLGQKGQGASAYMPASVIGHSPLVPPLDEPPAGGDEPIRAIAALLQPRAREPPRLESAAQSVE